MPFFLAISGSILSDAPPAGAPIFLPARSLKVWIELDALVSSANGARL